MTSLPSDRHTLITIQMKLVENINWVVISFDIFSAGRSSNSSNQKMIFSREIRLKVYRNKIHLVENLQMIFLPREKQTFEVMHKTESQFNNTIRSHFSFSSQYRYSYILFRTLGNNIYCKSDFRTKKKFDKKIRFCHPLSRKIDRALALCRRKKNIYRRKIRISYFLLAAKRQILHRFSFLAIIAINIYLFLKIVFLQIEKSFLIHIEVC